MPDFMVIYQKRLLLQAYGAVLLWILSFWLSLLLLDLWWLVHAQWKTFIHSDPHHSSLQFSHVERFKCIFTSSGKKKKEKMCLSLYNRSKKKKKKKKVCHRGWFIFLFYLIKLKCVLHSDGKVAQVDTRPCIPSPRKKNDRALANDYHFCKWTS